MDRRLPRSWSCFRRMCATRHSQCPTTSGPAGWEACCPCRLSRLWPRRGTSTPVFCTRLPSRASASWQRFCFFPRPRAAHSNWKGLMHKVPLTRRAVLASLGGTATALALRSVAAGSSDRSAARIVDVHAHYYPPALKATGAATPMNAWTLERHVEEMDSAGVARSLLSLTTPGIVQTGAQGRSLMRASNEYAAGLCSAHPGRFGFFTCVQADDVDGSLKEIEHGFDVLKAHGVG